MNPVAVLVVEDEAIVRSDLVKTLEAMHYDPLCAVSTGDEAVIRAREYNPDVVLMDISIPGTLDGIGAAGKIRDELDIPVIFVTSFADDAVIDRAKQVNPYGYVLKPFRERDIRVAIEIALARRAAEMQDALVKEAPVIQEGRETPGDAAPEYAGLPDIQALFLGDFFQDLVLLLYTSAGVKELLFTSVIEKSLKSRGGLIFAYSVSKAHRKFQHEIQSGTIRICRMKGGDMASLQNTLAEYAKQPDNSTPLRVIIDFSEKSDKTDILNLMDRILEIRKKGIPVSGLIALHVEAGDENLVSELSQNIPKVVLTTGRGTVISCAGHAFPLEHLSFLPQPVVDKMVKKVLEPVILSFLDQPVTGSEILHGIQERYNVSVPKARVYTHLYALRKMGYLSVRPTRKTKQYYPTEAGKAYIRQKLDEFNSVFHHILVEAIDRDAGIGTGNTKRE